MVDNRGRCQNANTVPFAVITWVCFTVYVSSRRSVSANDYTNPAPVDNPSPTYCVFVGRLCRELSAQAARKAANCAAKMDIHSTFETLAEAWVAASTPTAVNPEPKVSCNLCKL